MKIVIAFALLAIVAALVLAGRAMLQDGREGQAKTNRMVKALALRVGLSIALFLFILLAYKLGWIHPTGIPLK
ncbi:MAG: twin transmembrane helix small protein [Aquabacterium sp.]|nr:twin transmembrane helix small protein [Aquabacterium sp.]